MPLAGAGGLGGGGGSSRLRAAQVKAALITAFIECDALLLKSIPRDCLTRRGYCNAGCCALVVALKGACAAARARCGPCTPGWTRADGIITTAHVGDCRAVLATQARADGGARAAATADGGAGGDETDVEAPSNAFPVRLPLGSTPGPCPFSACARAM